MPAKRRHHLLPPGGALLWPLLMLACAAPAARSEEAAEEAWNARLQATYVWQVKPAMSAPYSGPNSLSTGREKSYTFSTTAALGMRPWAGVELYFDPEVTLGVPLSGLNGLGGFTNGEMQRTASSNPTLYRARLFLRQSWGLGGERQAIESDANQLAGMADSRRVVLTAGNLSVTDVFDQNAYAHDSRTQFMNWVLTAHGAYDYAADARGYTWGAALEYIDAGWALRVGRFLQPREPNGLTLDWRAGVHFGDQVEFERDYEAAGGRGKVRLLAFRNRAVMGAFGDATALAAGSGTVPDVGAVRRLQTKRGGGISIEHGFSERLGGFARAARSDGSTEVYAFSEIDDSASAGVILKGVVPGESRDALGIAIASNGLSSAHRDYLAGGGLGFFVGDGRLRYAREQIVEAFYRAPLMDRLWLTLDLQRIARPGYNADRGPASFAALRLHAEY